MMEFNTNVISTTQKNHIYSNLFPICNIREIKWYLFVPIEGHQNKELNETKEENKNDSMNFLSSKDPVLAAYVTTLANGKAAYWRFRQKKSKEALNRDRKELWVFDLDGIPLQNQSGSVFFNKLKEFDNGTWKLAEAHLQPIVTKLLFKGLQNRLQWILYQESLCKIGNFYYKLENNSATTKEKSKNLDCFKFTFLIYDDNLSLQVTSYKTTIQGLRTQSNFNSSSRKVMVSPHCLAGGYISGDWSTLDWVCSQWKSWFNLQCSGTVLSVEINGVLLKIPIEVLCLFQDKAPLKTFLSYLRSKELNLDLEVIWPRENDQDTKDSLLTYNDPFIFADPENPAIDTNISESPQIPTTEDASPLIRTPQDSPYAPQPSPISKQYVEQTKLTTFEPEESLKTIQVSNDSDLKKKSKRKRESKSGKSKKKTKEGADTLLTQPAKEYDQLAWPPSLVVQLEKSRSGVFESVSSQPLLSHTKEDALDLDMSMTDMDLDSWIDTVEAAENMRPTSVQASTDILPIVPAPPLVVVVPPTASPIIISTIQTPQTLQEDSNKLPASSPSLEKQESTPQNKQNNVSLISVEKNNSMINEDEEIISTENLLEGSPDWMANKEVTIRSATPLMYVCPPNYRPLQTPTKTTPMWIYSYTPQAMLSTQSEQQQRVPQSRLQYTPTPMELPSTGTVEEEQTKISKEEMDTEPSHSSPSVTCTPIGTSPEVSSSPTPQELGNSNTKAPTGPTISIESRELVNWGKGIKEYLANLSHNNSSALIMLELFGIIEEETAKEPPEILFMKIGEGQIGYNCGNDNQPTSEEIHLAAQLAVTPHFNINTENQWKSFNSSINNIMDWNTCFEKESSCNLSQKLQKQFMDIQIVLDKFLGTNNTQLPKGPLLVDDWGTIQPTLVPPVLVGYQDDWMRINPSTAVCFWEKCCMEPYASRKNIDYYILAPYIPSLDSNIDHFFQQLNCMYEICNFGQHQPGILSSKFNTHLQTTNTLYQNTKGIVYVPFGSRDSIREVCQSFAKECSSLASYLLESCGYYSSSSCVAIYVINPFTKRTSSIQFIKAMSVLLKKTLGHSNLNVVLEIIPLQQIILQGAELFLNVKELAYSVYSKSRRIVMPISQIIPNQHKMVLRSKLYEPPFILASGAQDDLLLHCCYTESEQRRFISCTFTDSRGELLETLAVSTYGTPLRSVFISIINYAIQIINAANGHKQSLLKGLVLGKLGAMEPEELQVWQSIIPQILSLSVYIVTLQPNDSFQLINIHEGAEEMTQKETFENHSFIFYPHSTCTYLGSLHSVQPRAISFIVTPTPSPLTTTKQQSVSSNHTSLMISLLSIQSTEKDIPNEEINRILRLVTTEYFNLSWLNTTPRWPDRHSVFPFHFAISERFSNLISILNVPTTT